jgi:hypothetical protein
VGSMWAHIRVQAWLRTGAICLFVPWTRTKQGVEIWRSIDLTRMIHHSIGGNSIPSKPTLAASMSLGRLGCWWESGKFGHFCLSSVIEEDDPLPFTAYCLQSLVLPRSKKCCMYILTLYLSRTAAPTLRELRVVLAVLVVLVSRSCKQLSPRSPRPLLPVLGRLVATSIYQNLPPCQLAFQFSTRYRIE